jgi:hypothetical protein
MTEGYATAKAVYRELRSTIGPWAKANDYRRWAGTEAGWQKPIDVEQRLLFKFEGSRERSIGGSRSCLGI